MPNIKITLSMNQQPIGYINYQLINTPDKMGMLGTMHVQPTQLLNVITRKIKQNEDINVRGGFTPPDLSPYFDGIYRMLHRMRSEIAGFDFHIPPEQDPYLEDIPPEDQKEIH